METSLHSTNRTTLRKLLQQVNNLLSFLNFLHTLIIKTNFYVQDLLAASSLTEEGALPLTARSSTMGTISWLRTLAQEQTPLKWPRSKEDKATQAQDPASRYTTGPTEVLTW